MKLLNDTLYNGIDEKQFLATKPFPFLNPTDALNQNAFDSLVKTMPDISLFTKTVGIERGYGQKPHDRYELPYKQDVPLSPEWKAFIDELYGEEYQKHISRIFGIKNFTTRCQWQYAYAGCSVSPHCDSRKKLGSQIFYFNTPEDWNYEWGGRTLILDDHGKKDWRSAPALSELDKVYQSEIIPNKSLLFKRTDHSWHAVEELMCPEGAYRKLFTVVFDKKPSFIDKVSAKLRTFIG